MFRECAFCAEPAGRERVCADCRALLPVNDPACERCGRPLAARQPAGVCCVECQRRPPVFDRACAPFRYEFPLDTAIRALKFRRELWYAPAFAHLILPTFLDRFGDCDLLVPVPLHRLRHARRGFNQARELCLTLHRMGGPEVFDGARRIRRTPSQAGLSRRQRRRNLSGAFAIRDRLPGTRPLIVDDVLTTGATADALAAALRVHGAESVAVLAVAATRGFN